MDGMPSPHLVGHMKRFDMTMTEHGYADAMGSPSCMSTTAESPYDEPTEQEALFEEEANAVLAFLRGEGEAGFPGRTLEAVLNWTDDKFEFAHDYIQWCFPSDIPCSSSDEKMALSTEDIALAHADSRVRLGIRWCFMRFLAFLGLEMVSTQQGLKIQKISGFNGFVAREQVCWAAASADGNHNWQRISQVLACLRVFDMTAELKAFYACLERLWARGHLPSKALSALQEWQLRAGMSRPLPEASSLTGLSLLKDKVSEVVQSGMAVHRWGQIRWKSTDMPWPKDTRSVKSSVAELAAVTGVADAILPPSRVMRGGVWLVDLEMTVVEGLRFSILPSMETYMLLNVHFTAFKGDPRDTGDSTRKEYCQEVEVLLTPDVSGLCPHCLTSICHRRRDVRHMKTEEWQVYTGQTKAQLVAQEEISEHDEQLDEASLPQFRHATWSRPDDADAGLP